MDEKKQNILVIGGGGRETAIVWKLAQSRRVGKIWCAPGNAGIADLAERVPIPATDLEAICRFAQTTKPDFVFVAPDDPLAGGLCDMLRDLGIRAFGPSRAAAQLEASKDFAKSLMSRMSIPTADFEVFADPEAALAYLAKAKYPLVIKADGLALGKGVLICQDFVQAAAAVQNLMVDDVFHGAGRKILVETFLEGEELTLLCFTDGDHWQAMLPARDYKRALDHNQGLNTGGMGSICPSHRFGESEWEFLAQKIIEPTLRGMRELDTPFQGVLYFGLMLTADGPKVIEYNARFGDPETQVILPLLKTDLLEIMEAIEEHRLDAVSMEWEDMACACVVLCSGGYPEQYAKGLPISGLEKWPLRLSGDTVQSGQTLEMVFASGTEINNDGVTVTAGGRVLGVISRAVDLPTALEKCYEMAQDISFERLHYRRDIGS